MWLHKQYILMWLLFSGKRILYIAFFNLKGKRQLRRPAAGCKKSARAFGTGKRKKSRARPQELGSNAEIDQGTHQQVARGHAPPSLANQRGQEA